jgi:parvulin-like peptidyl-prolyl isomerase
MNQRAKLIVSVIVLSIATGACAASDVAATVDSVDILDEQVLAMSVQDPEAATVPASNPCSDQTQVSPEQVCVGFRDDLTNLIVLQALLAGAERDFGLTGLDTDEARAAYLSTAPTEELQLLQRLVSDAGRDTQAFADHVTTQLLLRAAVRAALLKDDVVLNQLWETRSNPEIDYCVSHIVVETEAEAAVVAQRITAGEDFATVADEVSLDDTSVGGALPCPATLEQWVPEFGNVIGLMSIGDVSDPVETQFGWHVITLVQRHPSTFEEFAADPETFVPQDAIGDWWNAWIDETVGAADIKVRSQIGSWLPAADGISPPPASP